VCLYHDSLIAIERKHVSSKHFRETWIAYFVAGTRFPVGLEVSHINRRLFSLRHPEKHCFVGLGALRMVLMKSYILRYTMPYSPLKVNRHFRGKDLLHLQAELCLPPVFKLVSCLAYSSTLNVEARSFSETSADFQRITRWYIQENRTLHNFSDSDLILYWRSLHITVKPQISLSSAP
jgi:hypothetical protein